MATIQDFSGATPEQLCMLGLYTLGATLLQSSLSVQKEAPSTNSHEPVAAPRHSISGARFEPQVFFKPAPAVRAKTSLLRRSIEEHSVRPSFSHERPQVKPAARGKSFDLLSRPAPQPARPVLMNNFAFNASKLGIAGGRLEADAPPSPLSSGVELGMLAESPQKGAAWPRLPSFSLGALKRDARSGSVPDTSFPSPQTGMRRSPRSRAMSLDMPRKFARRSLNAVRPKKPSSPTTRVAAAAAPQLDTFSFPSIQGETMLCDLPRESTSSSGSEYGDDYEFDEFGRRHSISGSSGHEGFHARARGHAGGSFASTAPSTAPDSVPVSTVDGDEEDSDDEDDIEWEQPQLRRSCFSPVSFEGPQYGAAPPLQVQYEKPAYQAHGKPQKEGPKVSTNPFMLLRRGPRRVASSSSLGGNSAASNESSFSGRARRSFSQARTLLRIAPARPSTSDSEARPAAVYLQPINTGLISRPCQTTPNPVSMSTRSNSFSGSMTTNTNEASSFHIPSLYLATSEESGSVTGGSSGASSTSRSGRSWDSVPPELAALEELVLTECKFLSDLQLLLDVYVEGLKKLGLITASSLERITSNLDEIMAFSKFLIDCVRAFMPQRASPPTSISSQPTHADLHHHQGQAAAANQARAVDEANAPNYLGLSSKLVRELPARMEVFARYCMNYQAAKERLEFERDLRPAVATFIELSKSTNPALQGMDMQQFLVLPVQRVTRYPLLFGCLAKQSDKRRSVGNEIREEDEDAEFADDALQQRQDRAKVIHDNWLRLRDASSAICGITNLAISYQQTTAPRAEVTRARGPRPSISSPVLSTGAAQFGRMTPPPPAMVMRDETRPVTPAPAVAEQPPKLRSPSFSFSMTKRRGSAKKEESADSTPSSSVADTSSASTSSSKSLMGRLLKPFRHPST